MKLSVHLLQETLTAKTGLAPRRDLLVPDFGIRVAANSRYLPSIGLDHEWFRALAHDGLVRGMTGSHIVHVDTHLPVPDLLAELRSRYLATRYREEVRLLDILHAVPAGSNVVAQLDLTLEDRIRTGLQQADHAHELRHRGDFYVLAEGRWFLVDRAHLEHLEGALAGIPDVTAELAQRTRLVSLARHADLMTEDMDLVFTGRSFARGSATAKRYREWPDCRTELAAVHRTNWPLVPFREPRFVYAIGTYTGPGALPFFSKVTLSHHIDRIHAFELEVAVARHPLPTFRLPTPRSEGLPLRDPI
ncbi:hypothetical protein [Actinocrispum wychmicini]|uniref:Uncharacterized protein n=1 Tax=Actinocrispum wychmicini TaxID=1213861 RepID=A0A4R2JIB8_9PSEU|nr:hypothetical protein [Actinocrispum wychmicini]TCO58487.1 hypothetical protein EV192_105557 [Actinocrispum wychmicini]